VKYLELGHKVEGFAPSSPWLVMFVVTARILAQPRRPLKVARLQLSTYLLGAVDVTPLLLSFHLPPDQVRTVFYSFLGQSPVNSYGELFISGL